jgi:TRAP-type C4-dicarboxylate transport system substrate-binding protein
MIAAVCRTIAAATAVQQGAIDGLEIPLAVIEATGMKIDRVPDFKPFRAAVEPVYENFKGSIGADLLTEALAAVQ